jgi:hypothetical protein
MADSPMLLKVESTMVTDPGIWPLPSLYSRKPTLALLTVMLFQTQPQFHIISTAVLQPLNVRRAALNCWAPPSVLGVSLGRFSGEQLLKLTNAKVPPREGDIGHDAAASVLSKHALLCL